MPYDSRVLRIFIASPSDVNAERQAAVDIIQKWNDTNSFITKTVLLPLRWETHSTPSLRDSPQNLINPIVDQSDLGIGIFWTRIGTATSKSKSGTIEEIERIQKAEKEIMVYFSNRSLPTDVDISQIEKVRAYKKSLNSQGLYCEYGDIASFKKEFSKHLNLKINELIAQSPPMSQKKVDAEELVSSTIGTLKRLLLEQQRQQLEQAKKNNLEEKSTQEIDVEALTEKIRKELERKIVQNRSYDKNLFISDVKQLLNANLFPDKNSFVTQRNVLLIDTVFDFIIESSERMYLVLIRAYDNHYQSQNTARTLRNTLNTIKEQNTLGSVNNKEIQPIVIAPSNIRFLGKQSHQIPILKYIIDNKTFKNWEVIDEWLIEKSNR